MATNTTRLGLTKPDFVDVVDISELNTNADTIDANIGAVVVTSTTRPGSPFTGQIIHETDTDKTLVWDGTAWEEIGGAADLDDLGDVVITSPALGQSLVYNGSDWINKFVAYALEYVVVAGGGSGGNGSGAAGTGGGGGAGGYQSSVSGENSGGGASAESALTLPSGIYAITVGAGGAGSTTDGLLVPGVSSVFAYITTAGGGGGYGDSTGTPGNGNGGPGGSGGGAGGNGNNGGFVGGTPTTNQGFAGGANFGQTLNSSGAGGGGASAVGANASSGVGGAGGAGVSSSITGSTVTRGGGGGGSHQATGTRGVGGAGGGGIGANNTNNPGDGESNTGGGGGGGGGPAFRGGNGGSGVVIFKIPDSATVTFSGGVTETNATSNGFTVYTVTAAGPTDTVTIF